MLSKRDLISHLTCLVYMHYLWKLKPWKSQTQW